MSENIGLSVLLPVYGGNEADNLNMAIKSLVNQTRLPDELVIIRDGHLDQDLDSVVNKWREDDRVPVTRVTLSENIGLGGALREGLKQCNSEYTARMDADDISVPTRFQRQAEFLSKHPEVDLLGGYIEEFDGDPENILARREVPTTHEDIVRMAHFRSPFNHATVVMRTETAVSAGNYRAVDYMEDWDLWSRMFLESATAANMPEVHLKVRAGDDMYRRRGGIGYAQAEFNRQIEFLRRGFITPQQFSRNLLVRVPVRIVPDGVRGYIYQNYLRETTDNK